MALSSMHVFVESCIEHLKNIISLSYADLPNADAFHYTNEKKNPRFVIVTTDLTRKDFKYWEAIKFVVVRTNFPQF